MSYINFLDDPISKRYNTSFGNLCAGDPTKKILKLLDKCFVIVDQSKTELSFCYLENFGYPVDGYLSIDFEVCAGETLSIFDNSLESILSSNPSGATFNYPLGDGTEYIASVGPSSAPEYYLLLNDRNYSRGCIIYVEYPKLDKNGDDILPANMNCTVTLTDRELATFSQPVFEFFSHFANPETRDANKLINKIELTNPNQNFSIKVKGLIIYTKSNSDPADCAC